MQYKDAALGDTVYFWFALNGTDGNAGDGTTPLFDVRLAGATASAAPVLSGTPSLLSHANYGDGLYEVAVAATTGNGFAAGNEYAVFCTATISTVNPAGFVGSFKLRALAADLNAAIARVLLALPAAAADAAGGLPISDAGGLDLDAKIGALAFSVAGDVDVNVQSWKGSAAPDVATEANIAAAVRDVSNASPAAGSLGENVKDVLADTGTTLDGLIDAIKAKTDCIPTATVVTGSVATDAGNSATSFKTDLASAVDNFWNDALLLLTSGALAGQVKKVADYDGTNKIITVGTGFTGTPADAVTFVLINK